MNCQDFQASLYDYAEKTLPADRRRAVEEHGKSCEPCGRKLHGVQSLSCRELAEFLDDFVEGRMPEERREVFQLHLDMCPPCVDYLRSYEQTIRMGGHVCDGSEKEKIPEELVRAILEARKREC